MVKNESGKWFVFNREYVPLGWNSKRIAKELSPDFGFSDFPVYTGFERLTDSAIRKIITDPDRIDTDKNGNISRVFFYNDRCNPIFDKKHFPAFFEILQKLANHSAKK
jgi:hypothetical protein